MQTHLPDRIDLWRFCATSGSLRGDLLLRGMPRLTSLLNASSGSVKLVIEGSVDEQRVHFIAGRLEVTVEMICQRCMRPMQLPLAVGFRLGLVHAESQVINLPREYDPMVVPNKEVLTSELVEDELILALPLAPTHSDLHQCEANGFLSADGTKPAEKDNPFAALSTLLQDSKLKSD